MAQKPELVSQTGHSSTISALAFSPDGKLIASGSYDQMIILWDARTGTELRTLRGHPYPVFSVAFSPDKKTLASCGPGATKLWNVATGTELRPFDVEGDGSWSVVFSPDGRTLAIASFKALELWDVATRTKRRTLDEYAAGTVSLAFSPDGRTLASGNRQNPAGGSNSVTLWDMTTGARLRTLEGSAGRGVAFSGDGRMIASGSEDGPIKLWDASTGKELGALEGHGRNVNSVAFSPDSKTLASCGDDWTIRLWDVSARKELNGGEVWQQVVNVVAFNPDGNSVVSGSGENINEGKTDQLIHVWHFVTGEPVQTLKGHVQVINFISFSRDGKILASGSSFERGLTWEIKLWDLSTGAGLHVLKVLEGYYSGVSFSPDNQLLAAAADGIELWDLRTRTMVRRLGLHHNETVVFSHDGKSVAGGGEGWVDLWDVSSGAKVRSLGERPTDIVRTNRFFSLAFGPDDKTIAGVILKDNSAPDASVGEMKLYDLASGQEVRTTELRFRGRAYACFSADGNVLATSNGNTIKLWNVSTGAELRTLGGHVSEITGITFSPNGETVAGGASDGTIKVWDTSTGKQLSSLRGHASSINTLAYRHDKTTFASGSRDGKIKLWSTTPNQELASLMALDETDWAVITPEGLFDGSAPAWKLMIWRATQDTRDFVPAEAYFSDFYYPGLLADIVAEKDPKAPSDISQKDRRQPQLKLTLASSQPNTTVTARNIAMKLDVSELAANKDHKAGSGAQDVRLFRNGSLVKVWHGDVLKGKESVTLETTIPIVAGENKLTAYAFNHDNIKSSDATLVVNGADSLKRQGTLHILSVGVGKYANPNYNLNYTPDDAVSFASQLKLAQEKLGQYKSVEVSTLLNENATKQNILAELKKLTAAVQPEDAVVVYFSGHGKADGDHFYLIPHDLVYSGPRDQLSVQGLRQVLANSISDVELEEAFRDIDAGQIFMIIDACNSGQALENKDEPRRGPMNTRGLAQLAYEKGMYIMAASQNVEEAFVSEKLKHSYLTFALVEEGLKTNVADENRDGQVTLREWFDYASNRVPKLRDETLQGKSLEEVTPTMKAVRTQKTQTPRVFYRREAEAIPLVVARP